MRSSTDQFLIDSINQLDLALEQLLTNDRNADRFAFILIDNVGELALHRRAEEMQAENMAFRYRPPLHEKSVRDALEEDFAPKVHLAQSMSWISAAEAESLRHCHAYRNSAYHLGLRHETILHPLATFHFKNICKLLETYEPSGGWWSSSADVIPPRASKYLSKSSASRTERFAPAWVELRRQADLLGTQLIGSLSADMDNAITDIDESLDFLQSDSPQVFTRTEIVIDCQAWQFAATDKGQSYAASIGCQPDDHPIHVIERIKTTYDCWSEKTDPIPKWTRWLKALASETNEHKGLSKYCNFIDQTKAIRSAINRAALALDREIQSQIDAARGK